MRGLGSNFWLLWGCFADMDLYHVENLKYTQGNQAEQYMQIKLDKTYIFMTIFSFIPLISYNYSIL